MDYSTKPFTFKKKPVAIEAIKWTGTNFDTIKMFDPDVMLSYPYFGRWQVRYCETRCYSW